MQKRLAATAAALAATAFMLTAPAALASAPEYGRCVKQAGGRFANAACTLETAGVNKYEWEPGPGTKAGFHSTIAAGTEFLLETVTGNRLLCTGASVAGAIRNAKEAGGVIFTLTRCESGSLACNSAGQATGVVVTSALEGTLGVAKVGTRPPLNDQIALELHAPAGTDVMDVECAGLRIEVSGSVLHLVPANRSLTVANERFVQAKGRQKPEFFAGGVPGEHVLQFAVAGGKAEQAGMALSLATTFEEPIEVSTLQ